MATMTSRKTIRAIIGGLFAANGYFEIAYAYPAGLDEYKGESPTLFIYSDGTEQEMLGQQSNRAIYYIGIAVMIRIGDKSKAENLLDDSDQTVRQVIRDAITNNQLAGVGDIVTANWAEPSNTRSGVPAELYRIESYRLAVVVMQS